MVVSVSRTAKELLEGRRWWREELGYNAAQVACVFMDEELARHQFGDELVERIRTDVYLVFIGEAADWGLA